MKTRRECGPGRRIDVIRRFSLTMMATWNGNLYKRSCRRVRAVASAGEASNRSRPLQLFDGSATAGRLAAASLDSVLTVLTGETADHKWQFDIATDISGLCFGSPVGRPLASREEAEKGALGGPGLLGMSLEPADEYEPEDLKHWHQIRINQTVYPAAELTSEQLATIFVHICRELGQSPDEVQISCARMLLEDAAGHRATSGLLTSLPAGQLRDVALAVLANCGWTHVSEEVIQGFAAANGVDLVGLDDKIRCYAMRTEVSR